MKLRALRFSLTALVATTTFIFATSLYASARHYKEEYHAPRYRPAPNYKAEVPTAPLYNCCEKKILLDGLYIGADAGYDAYRIRQKTVTTDDGITVTRDPALSLKGWNGAAFAGYGRYFEWFYMGGELLARYSGANNSYTLSLTDPFIAASYHLNMKARQTYGVGILPGVKVNDSTLVYLRVDYLRSWLDTNEIIAFPGVHINSSHSVWSNGVNFGAGLETVLVGNLSLRGEYTYTTYTNFFSDLGSKFSPTNNQADIGLILHFC